MARKATHPNADTLVAFADADASLDTVTRDHIQSCTSCAQRVAELQTTRRLLQDVGTFNVPPPYDIARRAVERLRLRRTAVGNVNEVFAAMRALLRGIADLFGGQSPEAPASRREERTPRG